MKTSTTSRTPPESINRLTLAQQYKLLKHMEDNYVKSGLLDAAYAQLAGAELGLVITVGNIQGCRDALSMESNRDRARKERAEPKTRFEKLEQRLAALEALVHANKENLL